MDVAWTIYLRNDFMIRKRLTQLSQSRIPFTSLYSRYIIWQIMILIVGRSCVFAYSYDDVVFIGVSHVIYITRSKIDDDILTFLQLCLIKISLFLQCHVLVLDGSYLVIRVCDGQMQLRCPLPMPSLDLNYSLLMIFVQFVGQLLPNMQKHHITAMSSEVFCFWLLTSKNQFLHTFLIDINIVFLRISGPINWCACGMHTAHSILFSEVFLTTMIFDDGCSFSIFTLFQCFVDLLSTCSRLSIDIPNVQIYFIKGKCGNRTHFIIYFEPKPG